MFHMQMSHDSFAIEFHLHMRSNIYTTGQGGYTCVYMFKKHKIGLNLRLKRHIFMLKQHLGGLGKTWTSYSGLAKKKNYSPNTIMFARVMLVVPLLNSSICYFGFTLSQKI